MTAPEQPREPGRPLAEYMPALAERLGMAPAEQPRRRFADLLVGEEHLDEGRRVVQEHAEQDRLDPSRPLLSTIVAGVIAEAEERGREEVRVAIRAMIEQRSSLRDERRNVARKHLDGNLPHAAAELSWAAKLDEDVSALRVLLGQVTPS